MEKVIGELYVGGCRLDDFIGVGYLIKYNEFIDETRTKYMRMEDAGYYYLTTTDNRIELLSVIYGLQSIIDNIKSQKIKLDQIKFHTPSKFLYNAYNKGWIYNWKANNWMKPEWNGNPPRPIKNSDLWKILIACDEKLKQMGVYFQLYFLPPGLTHASYRKECIDQANQLTYKAAEEVFNMREKYYDELLYELYGDDLYNPY